MRMIFGVILFCHLVCAAVGHGQEVQKQAEATALLPDLISALRVKGPIYFCDESVPLQNQDVRERLEKEILLTLWDRAQIILWIKRSGRYMPVIEKVLKEHGLPDDLKYIAVVESALLPHIGSAKDARGYWQFIKATGRRYGLTIDNEKDERRNIFSSTRAACLYLKRLYSLFRSWSMAAAAYNMGEKRLQAEMEAQEINDYYQLYLPLETQRYLFKIIAAKMILSDPSRYGFLIEEEDLYPPLEFDRVTFNCPVNTPIQLIAKAADSYFKKIKDLNPEIRGKSLSKGHHTLAVPKGAAHNFHVRYDALVAKWQEESRIQTYIVKEGDNLSGIANRFDVSLQSLYQWNNVGPKNYLYPGKELIISQ